MIELFLPDWHKHSFWQVQWHVPGCSPTSDRINASTSVKRGVHPVILYLVLRCLMMRLYIVYFFMNMYILVIDWVCWWGISMCPWKVRLCHLILDIKNRVSGPAVFNVKMLKQLKEFKRTRTFASSNKQTSTSMCTTSADEVFQYNRGHDAF